MGDQIRKALVVDDDATIRLVAQRQLTRLGFSVVTAASGKEAVAAFEEHQPSLILMDIQMPDMDGIEATSKIRTAHPDKSIVVIAMTASQIREVVLAAGLDDYLFKPFLFDELRSVVKRWLPVDESGNSAEPGKTL